MRKGAAGSTGEAQRERLTVPLRPIPHHIGDKSPVVFGCQPERAICGPADVDAVHPDIAGQDDVEKLSEEKPITRARDGHTTERPRNTSSSLDGGLEPILQLASHRTLT